MLEHANYLGGFIMFDITYCGYNIRNSDCDIIDRPNGSNSYLLLYFMSPMEIILNNRKLDVYPNTLLLYTPGYRQWYRAKKTFYNSFVHFVDPDNFVEKLNIPLNELFTIEDSSELNDIIRHIENDFLQKEILYQEKMSASLQLLLILISRSYNKSTDTYKIDPFTSDKFFKLRMHILSNLDYNWNLTNMAKLANLSNSQFYNYYSYIFKQSPKADLIDARLEHSKYLLTHSSLQVNEIARKIGYSNVSQYIRLFKKRYGKSPKQYAKGLQKD